MKPITEIKYYPHDDTVGHKEPMLLEARRTGRGCGVVYQLIDSYGNAAPEDVYLFIANKCADDKSAQW